MEVIMAQASAAAAVRADLISSSRFFPSQHAFIMAGAQD
jgi:hypothetical protein